MSDEAWSRQNTLALRRLLLGAFVDPSLVLRADLQTKGDLSVLDRMRAQERGHLEIGEPFTAVACTIVDEGSVPAPMRTADASIDLGVSVDAIAAKHGLTRDDVLGMLAVAALRVAAREPG